MQVIATRETDTMKMNRFLAPICALVLSTPTLALQEEERAPTGDPWIDSLPNAGDLFAGGEDPLADGSWEGGGSSGGGDANGSSGTGGRGASGSSGASSGPIDPWLAAGRSAPSSTVAASEVEPNDSFGTAQLVGPNARIGGRLEPARDVDRFTFDVPRRGTLEVIFETVPQGFAPAIEVRNAENSVVQGWTNLTARNGRTDSFMIDLQAAGRFFLAVGDKNSAATASDYAVGLRYLEGDRFEPNGSFGQATEVPADLELIGTILPLRDVDRYTFTVERRGAVEISLDHIAAALDLHIEVRNGENSVVLGWTALTVRDGVAEPFVVDLQSAGRYYLAISDGKNDARSEEPYRLRLRQMPGDANEPNESMGTATQVSANLDRKATLMPLRDVDRYSFEIDRRGAMEIRLDGVAPELDPQVEVRNAEHSVVLGWTALSFRDGSSEPLIVDLNVAGRYFVAIADGKNDARSETPYRLRLRQMPGDKNEPNGSYGTATVIDPDGTFETSIMPLRDQDWFRFEVDRPGMTELSFDSIPGDLAPAFMLRNGEGSVLLGWTTPATRDGKTEPFALDLPAAGVYYLMLAESGDKHRAVESFRFRLRHYPGDAHEPNPSIGTAKSVALGAQIRGNVLPARDVDWYRFDASAAGTLEVRFTSVPASFKPAISVRNREGSVILGTTQPSVRNGGTDPVEVELREGGAYYLLVWDQASGRSVDPYAVTVTMR